MLTISKKFLDFITPLYKAIRSTLGYWDVCIYPVSCGRYARYTLQNKNIFIALPLIILRVLSCNPITGIIRSRFIK